MVLGRRNGIQIAASRTQRQRRTFRERGENAIKSVATADRKAVGAYYTDGTVADFLARWAVRTADSAVLEPCCGQGVFVRAAAQRLAQLGADSGGSQITAVDVDGAAVPQAVVAAPGARFVVEDFFKTTPEDLGCHDALIGNPPFVRYHLFTGAARWRALAAAAEIGVRVSGLTSAWVPFLLHATRFLKPDGRMAVVAPFEVTYAIYARPFVAYLASHFAEVSLLTFEEPLFPDLNEKTVLLLCDGYGGQSDTIGVAHLNGVQDLAAAQIQADSRISTDGMVDGTARVRLLDAPSDIRELYADLTDDIRVVHLGELARLTIGYVTGDNAFFHLSRAQAVECGLPESVLRVAVRKGSDFSGVGLGLDASDARRLAQEGEHLLFCPEPHDVRQEAVIQYIRSGEAGAGASSRFKARTRSPWWLVPGVNVPDMFLTVFGHTAPRLVANDARVVATNSILVLRLKADDDPHLLAAAACTSLAALSAEVEGHHLGGGALKFEPCEARRWLLPARVDVESGVLLQIDRALRGGDSERATALADVVFLEQGLGLTRQQVAAVQEAAWNLRNGRAKRRQPASTRASMPRTNWSAESSRLGSV